MTEQMSAATCPECGAALREGDRFCGKCGTRLEEAGGTGERVSLDRLFDHLRHGEQRPATILMTDISGFTALGERVDPEQLFNLINRVFHEFVEILVSHGAHIDKYVGDEIVALFGVPRAQERSAERAVFAALAIRDRLAELNSTGQFGELSLGVHMGINIGPVMVGPVGHRSYLDYTVIGDAVNLAKRLETEAPDGEIYVSQAVREAAGAAFDLAPIGSVKVKGREAEVEVFRVVGARSADRVQPAEAGRDYPLLARERELEELRECARQALTGAVRVVGIVGPAGIGKSKLVRAWRAADGEDSFRLLFTSCYSCGDQFPLLPLLDLTSQLGGYALEGWPPLVDLSEADGSALGGESDAVGSLIALMQGTPGEADAGWRDEIAERFGDVLATAAATKPLCVVVDNAQWMDESSREVLAQVAAGSLRAPVLFVLVGRDLEGSWVSNLNPADLIALSPLPRSAMEELIALWALPLMLPKETIKAIGDRAEGHPYFARELVRSLRRPHGDPISGAALPGSLHELFLAQLDSLPKPLRRLVQAASVVGEPLTVSVLRAALGADGESLDGPLQNAVKQDLLRRSTIDGQYAFRRRLLFEAAYETIPPTQRRTLHTQIAGHLTENLEAMGEMAIHAAAHHAYLGQRDAQALELLMRSAQRYRAQYSNRQAVRAATRALEIISSLPDPDSLSRERLQALLVVAQACTILGDLGAAEGTLAEAEIVAEDCADQELVARVALQAATCSLMLGEPDDAYRRFGRAREAWSALADITRVAHSLVGMGLCAQQLGDRGHAVELLREAAAMPEAAPWVRAAALNNAGILLLEDGHYAEAEAQVREGLRENTASDDRRGVAHSHCSLGEVLYLRGLLDEAKAQLDTARALAAEIEDAHCLEETTLNLARVLVALHEHEEARRLLEEHPPTEGLGPQAVLLRQSLSWQVGIPLPTPDAQAAWCPTDDADSGGCWNTHADSLCARLEKAVATGDRAATGEFRASLQEALPKVPDRQLARYAHWLIALAEKTDGGEQPARFEAGPEPTVFERRAAALHERSN